MADAKNGLNRCPKCGATDISLNASKGLLKCNFCRAEFPPTSVNGASDIESLSERKIGGGAKDIIPDTKTVLTFNCSSCGAKVVINADEATSARCHWCRHVFSINEQIENGAVPDMVLPFKMEKAAAEQKIKEFVGKRQFYAHPKFKKEFTTENIMGAYLPYMVIDVNAHAQYEGIAEHLVRSYTVKRGDHTETRYDADAYSIAREFDVLIDDLTIESSSDKLNQNTLINTTNVINSIMPFDTENCVAWDANYLRGYASEKRDTNVDDLVSPAKAQAADIARARARETIQFYDRGAKWSAEQFDVKGAEWKSAYLPVWLYSYLQDDGKKKLLHYVAVNARTGETMGSVPVYKAKLFMVSLFVEIVAAIFGSYWAFDWFVGEDFAYLGFLGYLTGFVYYAVVFNKYRNKTARHRHESDTKSETKNVRASDRFIEHRKGLSNRFIDGRNDTSVNGALSKLGGTSVTDKIIGEIGKHSNIPVDFLKKN